MTGTPEPGGEPGLAGTGAGLAARILTVSDGVVAGTRDDRSGPALQALLAGWGYEVESPVVSADGAAEVAEALRRLTGDFTGLVVTTGGTGFGPRDLTPEATRSVIEREAPGLAEGARAASPLGRLSRGVAGTVGSALVLNLPGSVGGATECLSAVADVVPHALRLLAGRREH